MKISSQQVGRGKLGNAIYSEVGGACIARAYRESISNPSTPAQVAQRAKMKLMTQVGANMAPVIAIPKAGLVSSRNKFVSKNFPLTSYDNGAASVDLSGIQLTDGHSSLPGLSVENEQAGGLVVSLASAADATISRVVYIVYAITADKQLSLVDSKVVETAGENRLFPETFAYQSGSYIVYAYGMRDMNSGATAKFANMGIQNASVIASLVATRTLSSSDYQFTATCSYQHINNPGPVQPGGGDDSD